VKGWVINISSPRETCEVDRAQLPIWFDSDGDPVFEVWFWHRPLQLWFVMAALPGTVQGVVYFSPSELPDQLRERVRVLEEAHAAASPD
jgi:hypothetical protein